MESLQCKTITSEQAMLIPILPDASVDDYLRSVASKIGALNICSFFFTNTHFKVYLKDMRYVEILVKNGIEVNGCEIAVEYNVPPSTKVTLLNVDPVIPNLTLTSQLCVYGSIDTNFQRLNITNKCGFSHIEDSKRVVYMTLYEGVALPEQMLVEFGDIKCRINIMAEPRAPLPPNSSVSTDEEMCEYVFSGTNDFSSVCLVEKAKLPLLEELKKAVTVLDTHEMDAPVSESLMEDSDCTITLSTTQEMDNSSVSMDEEMCEYEYVSSGINNSFNVCVEEPKLPLLEELKRAVTVLDADEMDAHVSKSAMEDSDSSPTLLTTEEMDMDNSSKIPDSDKLTPILSAEKSNKPSTMSSKRRKLRRAAAVSNTQKLHKSTKVSSNFQIVRRSVKADAPVNISPMENSDTATTLSATEEMDRNNSSIPDSDKLTHLLSAEKSNKPSTMSSKRRKLRRVAEMSNTQKLHKSTKVSSNFHNLRTSVKADAPVSISATEDSDSATILSATEEMDMDNSSRTQDSDKLTPVLSAEKSNRPSTMSSKHRTLCRAAEVSNIQKLCKSTKVPSNFQNVRRSVKASNFQKRLKTTKVSSNSKKLSRVAKVSFKYQGLRKTVRMASNSHYLHKSVKRSHAQKLRKESSNSSELRRSARKSNSQKLNGSGGEVSNCKELQISVREASNYNLRKSTKASNSPALDKSTEDSSGKLQPTVSLPEETKCSIILLSEGEKNWPNTSTPRQTPITRNNKLVTALSTIRRKNR